MSLRPVTKVSKSRPTREGAGVHLRRAFGFDHPTEFDPFLLFDDFRNEVPEKYLAGFPWHPHRGIETITYVLSGEVDHKDSLGNKGVLGAGDVQWMTAGRGIIHQEMPRGDAQGKMHGFQLWANLPAAHKMTAPRYQDVESKNIPEVIDDDGTRVRVVCGTFWGRTGPVDGIAADPQYLDISVPPLTRRKFPIETTRHTFAYVFGGGGVFGNASGPQPVLTDPLGEIDTATPTLAEDCSLVSFGRGDEVEVASGPDGMRFLLVSGQPIKEPVAWRGPIVMNTEEELRQAFQDYRNGEFAKR